MLPIQIFRAYTAVGLHPFPHRSVFAQKEMDSVPRIVDEVEWLRYQMSVPSRVTADENDHEPEQTMLEVHHLCRALDDLAP